VKHHFIHLSRHPSVSSSQIIFITLFCAGAQHCTAVPFTSHRNGVSFYVLKFVARVARGCDKAKPLWLFAKIFSVM